MCEDWTVYLRHVKYHNGEANATASDVSEAKTVLQQVTYLKAKQMRVRDVAIGRRKA
jgi:hypothetical protein